MARLRRLSSLWPAAHNGSGARGSTRAPTMTTNTISPSPQPSFSSDKENREDPRMAGKGKGRALPQQDLPTPESEGRGPKRRRLLEERGVNGTATARPQKKPEDFYDPDQDPEERRRVRLGIRDNLRTLHDNRDKLLEPNNKELEKLIDKGTELFKHVKQTADATGDARFLVDAADLVVLKNRRIALGDETLMLQSDDFVSKCITFMRLGGAEGDEGAEITATQARRRTRTLNDDEEDDEDGDALAWDYLGRRACYQNVRRPPVPAFLLGPLSVQKKARAPTQRQGRLRRDQPSTLTKPQELREEDLERNEKSTLTHKCKEIRDSLHSFVRDRSELVDADVEEEARRHGITDVEEDERAIPILKRVLKRHRLASNWEVSLFEYAINPQSFGQTVENLFYISFLVRDGFVKLNYDSEGLPTIRVLEEEERRHGTERERGSARHQAIFSLDYATWQKLIMAFDIESPLIPHREEEYQPVGACGWYS